MVNILQKTTISNKNNSAHTLSEMVEVCLEEYFTMLEHETPSDVYEMVTNQVEEPMVKFVLNRTDYNQTKTAEILGINRNTLRKKIQQYKIKK